MRMLAVPSLSQEQQQIFDPRVRVVEAGPGSGKTRVLVARFLEDASRSPAGVALVSFTNAAIDEVRARATDPALTQAPHFVGTIDAFLNRFIVTPRVVPSLGKAPTYLRSWADLPEHHYGRVVRVKEVAGAGIGLDKFLFRDREVEVAASALRDDEEKYLDDVVAADLRAKLIWIARKRISDYMKAGVFDPTTARRIAARALKSAAGPQIIERLGRRFGLLLIDEAQDCDMFEFGVFTQLALAIPTIVAADPDQAIFEFRGGSPLHFVNYRDAQPECARMDLTENYRSVGSICKTVSALRSIGKAAVVPADGTVGRPVLVLEGTKSEVRAKFVAALAEHDASASDAIVLAHSRAVAAEVAGRSLPSASRACGNRLAAVCAALGDSAATVDDRLRAILNAEAIVLSLMKWSKDDPRSCSRLQQLEILEKESTWLRATCAQLVASLAGSADADGFGRDARRVLSEALDGLPREMSVSTKVKCPDATAWAARHRKQPDNSLEYDTIHGYKGRERPAVLVALYGLRRTDGANVIDVWEADEGTEARRVLYVGASRAESLLAFAATAENARRITKLLEAANVPVERR